MNLLNNIWSSVLVLSLAGPLASAAENIHVFDGRYCLNKLASSARCSSEYLTVNSVDDEKSRFYNSISLGTVDGNIDAFFDVNSGVHSDGYGVNGVKTTLAGTQLTRRSVGVDGVLTTTLAIDPVTQNLVENSYSFGQLTSSCVFVRD